MPAIGQEQILPELGLGAGFARARLRRASIVLRCRTVARIVVQRFGEVFSAFSCTKSQLHSLLSGARLDIAGSRVRPTIYNRVRIAPDKFGFQRQLMGNGIARAPRHMRRIGVSERHGHSPLGLDTPWSLGE